MNKAETKRLCQYDAIVQFYLEYRPLSEDAQAKMNNWLIENHLDKEIGLDTIC